MSLTRSRAGRKEARQINDAIRADCSTVEIKESVVSIPDAIQGIEPGTRRGVGYRRLAMGYDEQPPTCRSCVQFIPVRLAVPVLYIGPLSARCKMGDFTIVASAICDCWTDRKTGKRLTE